MAVPKKRLSRSRRDMRRAHDHITLTAAVETCPACMGLKLRHHVCPSCGYYRGTKVIPVAAS